MLKAHEWASPVVSRNSSLDIKPIFFSKLPVHDTCWSITTGKDGRIYVGVCGEMTGGLGVYLVSYDPVADRVRYVLDVAEALGESPDNGHATHSKIHYCLVPSDDGGLYGATHCTGAPVGDFVWRPWNSWDDPIRMFTGFHIFRYDLETGGVEDFGSMAPNEGSRAMALCEKHRKLVGITYPRDHFYTFDLKSNEYRDLGRIGDINSQSVFLDRDENAYTVDDYGSLVKYDQASDRLMHLDVRLPYADYREGSFNLMYDSVPSTDGESIYGVHWNVDIRLLDNRLFRYDPFDGPEGKIHDLGWAYRPEEAGPASADFQNHHTGGLVFGPDGHLYFATYVHWKEPKGMYLIRMNTETLEREELGPILDSNRVMAEYVAKATIDFQGGLYFATCASRPTGIFAYRPEAGLGRGLSFADVRRWG